VVFVETATSTSKAGAAASASEATDPSFDSCRRYDYFVSGSSIRRFAHVNSRVGVSAAAALVVPEDEVSFFALVFLLRLAAKEVCCYGANDVTWLTYNYVCRRLITSSFLPHEVCLPYYIRAIWIW
jgi:hypothetical protein